MSTESIPTTLADVRQKASPAGISAIQSILLLFLLFFPLTLMQLGIHEGGHALADIANGDEIRLFYVHPFSLNGYVRSDGYGTNAINAAAGHVLSLLISLILFIPLWKRRSVSNLPFVMLFPWLAIMMGVGLISLARNTGDYFNIIKYTGLSATLFYIPIGLLGVIGLFFFISLFPLIGLAPKDKKSIFVIPASLLLWSAVGIIVYHLFVPGSPIDNQFHLAAEQRAAVYGAPLVALITGALASVLYLTFYRWVYRIVPASLQTAKVALTWKDLRIPALLFLVSVTLGIIAIA